MALSPDAHSLSRLRDAFFHPVEHEYTLPEISEMLGRIGLRCTGLEADAELRKMFAAAFEGRRDFSDLDAWHALEQRMPELFIGMYELFVVRH